MDIDGRNFVDVMKELSDKTGIDLPKDNQDNKNYPTNVVLRLLQKQHQL